MTLDELIAIANDGYNKSGLQYDIIKTWHTKPKGKHCDMIAKFIATELKETFSEEACTDEQIAYAIKKLEEAQQDIQNVIDQLYSVDADHKKIDDVEPCVDCGQPTPFHYHVCEKHKEEN